LEVDFYHLCNAWHFTYQVIYDDLANAFFS